VQTGSDLLAALEDGAHSKRVAMKVLGEANVWEMHVSSLLHAALPGTICVRVRVRVGGIDV